MSMDTLPVITMTEEEKLEVLRDEELAKEYLYYEDTEHDLYPMEGFD